MSLRSLLRPLPVLMALAITAPIQIFAAEGGTAPVGTAPGGSDQGGENRSNGRDRWMQRMIAENPELKDVDPNTPEGQDKIRAVMQARMEAGAPEMRQRMAEGQAARHAELKTVLALQDEEFAAIQPLLLRVENLTTQKGMVDRSAAQGMMGRGRGRGGPMIDPKLLLGDTPLEPTVQEIDDAVKALKALIEDPQANADETEAAVARLRKARQAFQDVLNKAQEELRSVLTQRQEAILVDRGTLQ